MIPETELRSRLRDAAQGAHRGTGLRSDAAADGVIARHRTQRRHRAAGLAAAACVAALVVVGVQLGVADRLIRPTVAEAPATGSATSQPEVFPGPARGALAADPAFVAEVLALPWSRADDPVPVTEPTARRLVWAEDVGTHRLAFVVGKAGGQSEGVWFSGPAGAGAASMERAWTDVPVPLAPGQPASYVDRDQGLLVVAADPGDDVEVAEAVDVQADGRVTRRYRAAEVADGIATAPVRIGPVGESSGHYRVLRNGRAVGGFDVGSRVSYPPDVRTPIPPAGRAVSGEPNGAAVDTALTAVLGPLGIDQEDAGARLMWAGDVPGPSPARTQAVLLSVPAPSGASVVVGTWWFAPDVDLTSEQVSFGSSVPCLLTTLPAGSSPESASFAMRCPVSEPSGERWTTALVLSGPGTATSAQLLTAAGEPSGAAVPLTDGGAAIADTPTYTGVRFLDAAGAELATVDLPPSRNDRPMDLYDLAVD